MTDGIFPKADGDAIGPIEINSLNIVNPLAGENVTAGNVIYIKASDGKAYISSTASALTMAANGIVLASATSGNTVKVITRGNYTTSGLTANTVYYLGTAGAVSTVASEVRVGVATSTTNLFIDFQQNPGDSGPIYLNAFQPHAVVQGTWAVTLDTGCLFAGYLSNSSAAQNDEITYSCVLAAGTYAVDFIVVKDTDRGIVTITVGNATPQTQDMRNGSLVKNALVTVSGFVVAFGGLTTVKFKVATSAASGYVFAVQSIMVRRTA